MAPSKMVLTLTAIAAAWSVSAAADDRAPMASAPTGTSETRYCMRVAAFTGSRIERVKCWTREKWSAQGADVDRDWPQEGVRTIG